MRALPIALLASCLVANRAGAVDIHKTAVSGERTVIHTYASWKVNCEANHGVVKVQRKPSAGRLSTEQVNTTIGTNRVGNNSCTGKPIKGFRVYYMPKAGFRGTDSFEIDVSYGDREPIRDVFHVTVQ